MNPTYFWQLRSNGLSPFTLLALLVVALLPTVVSAAPPAQSHIILQAPQPIPEPPLFFTATVDHEIRVESTAVTAEAKISVRVVQGRAETITLGLSGEGEIASVTGAGLRDWSVRRTAEAAGSSGAASEGGSRRHLVLRLDVPVDSGRSTALEFLLRAGVTGLAAPARAALPLVTAGEAVGFRSRVSIRTDGTVNVDVTRAIEAARVDGVPASSRVPDALEFVSTGEARIEVLVKRRGVATAEVDWTESRLTGRVNEATGSVDFQLRGQARVNRAGARIAALSGGVALTGPVTGEGWRAELSLRGGESGYDLIFERPGVVAVVLDFAVPLREVDGLWRVGFRMPAGVVSPLTLTGMSKRIEFEASSSVMPTATEGDETEWRGFVPAGGDVTMAWKRARETAGEALFFTSSEEVEIEVGAGLLRRTSQLSFRILQGRLSTVRVRVDGPGEITGVEGAHVVGWKVLEADPALGGARSIEAQLSRPMESEGRMVIRSQSALGAFPAHGEPLRLTPEGGVRHSGFARVASRGAIRLEVMASDGLMQLTPEQYPGPAAPPGARQVSVYRFPSANYAMSVVAHAVLSEVGVSHVSLYEITETDRVIHADIELDIREAPLREWTFLAPADYTVAMVKGGEVADHAADSGTDGGYRATRVLFAKAVEGRQLLQVRLEKNQPAVAGEWTLPPLRFPCAKSMRGHAGVVAVAGYRIILGPTQNTVEMPLGFFPKQTPGLQQAFRIRDAAWSAMARIEALGQSVQADVFHLHLLKEGVAHASVLLNYFVVGAPATEWRIEVPESAGNIDVTGLGVKREWRREGNQVVVALSQPVLGATTVLLSFDEPMSARGGTLRPGMARPIGAQSERGYAQVVSALQAKVTTRKAEGGLLKLEPMELPAEYRLLSTAPSLALYQYTGRPFELELAVEWLETARAVDQVIDFARLTSRVSREGEVVTEARFFVKSRGQQALQLKLPDGVKLWEARSAGETVSARTDGAFIRVPLPPRSNPNEPVEVALRLGQPAVGAGRSVTLRAPTASVPMIMSEWVARADSGRLLVPAGGSARLVRSPLTETGFEWISAHGRGAVIAGAILAVLSMAGIRARSARWLPSSAMAGVCACVLAVSLGWESIHERRVNLRAVHLAANMVPAGETVSVDVRNVPVWAAMASIPGVISAATGMALGILGWRWMRQARVDTSARRGERRGRLALAAGVALLCLGTLLQRGGAPWFFSIAGIAMGVGLVRPALARAWRVWRGHRSGPAGAVSATVSSPVMPALIMALGIGVGGVSTPALEAKEGPQSAERVLNPAGPTLSNDPADPPAVGDRAAESIIERWDIRGGRLYGELEIIAHGAPGDRFVLLKKPAVLTDFVGDGLRVAKSETGNVTYYVTLDRLGGARGMARFEVGMAELGEGVPILAGGAATRRIGVLLDQGGWEFSSPMAARVEAEGSLGEGRSGATLWLGAEGEARIFVTPKRRDLGGEQTRFFAETATVYLPGPGVVNGRARVTVRPAQGRVTELELDVPEGFTVGEVGGGPVGTWRFDPEKRRLRIAVEPAQAEAFSLVVELQRGASGLPFDLSLRAPVVRDAAGEVGLLALAFGADAQPEAVSTDGLSAAGLEDFDASLLPRGRDGQPLASLRQVFRYSQAGGSVKLRAGAVAPEVRLESKQRVSIGEDRVLLAADLRVEILRVGIFKLSFEMPVGLEVETVSGPSLSHWTEGSEGGRRIVTLHLKGRTLGRQAFSVTLAGPGLAAQLNWRVPSARLREAARQTGELLIVPERGLRVRATERRGVSPLDPRVLGNGSAGAVAFRLLQEDWALGLALETLDPWITAQSFLETLVREGQVITSITTRFRVENAAIRQARVRLPGLTAEQARTLRVSGPEVSDIAPVPREADLWEIRFRRGVVGETDTRIEFQGPASVGAAAGFETVAAPMFVGARQVTQFVAARGAGRVEVEAAEAPRGWEKADWNTVPSVLRNRGDRSVPALVFRVAEAEGPLRLATRRHEVADALKARVLEGEITTVFSAEGSFLTSMRLNLDLVEKTTLRARLPRGARVFGVWVNGESATVAREGEDVLVHVGPETTGSRTATARVDYEVNHRGLKEGGGIKLGAPGVNLPLENLRWRVVVPVGYEAADFGGWSQETSGLGIADYEALLAGARTEETRRASALLEQASSLLQSGQQRKAEEVLGRVSRTRGLDEATNEDARVQLRRIKTRQAVVGLNTRRQRLYLDNSGDVLRNEQLEQAAHLNPLIQGRVDFDARESDQLLMGNTAEENAALRGIAGRLVDQQLAAEPAPSAIEVTLPRGGKVLTFMRAVRVDGNDPLELSLKIAPTKEPGLGFGLGLVAFVGALVGFTRRCEAGAEEERI